MKRNELIKLRELVNIEVKRRERIKELLKNDLIKEYLEIIKSEINELDSNNIHEILNGILPTFNITETNGIYVCTSAWYDRMHIGYDDNDTYYYGEYVEIDSEHSEYKSYVDIESNKKIVAVKNEEERYGRPLIDKFEINNIVLNPYNTGNNKNGFDEVKMDFFETAIKDGQAKAKKLILSKYPRI